MATLNERGALEAVVMKLPPKSSLDPSASSTRRRNKTNTSKAAGTKAASTLARETKARAVAGEQQKAAQASNTKTARHRAREAQVAARALLPRASQKEGVRLRPQRTSAEQNQETAWSDRTSREKTAERTNATPRSQPAASAASLPATPSKQAQPKAMGDDEQTASKAKETNKGGARRGATAQREAPTSRHYVPPSQHVGLVPSHLRSQSVHARTPARLTSLRTTERNKLRGRPSAPSAQLTSGETKAVEATEHAAETLEENRYRPRDNED